MKELLFGTAGIPLSSNPRTTADGIRHVKKLGLGCMELEFVHSINISKEKAPEIKKVAEENNIVLTCHAPYYINLNSAEKAKCDASCQRIINSARILKMCGGYSLCFHSGFYMGQEPKKVYETIMDNLKSIIKTLKNEGINIWIRPETTGKETQFGNVDEILQLSQEFDNVMPCIDFAHFHARTNGKYNSYGEFASILEKIEKTLGKTGLENMHIHITGIAYGPKGEKNHLNLEESDLKYKELLKALKDFKVKGVVVCESPNIEGDAMLMKKTYEKL
ncbi:TIM barrel protein [Candidatus Woesearchaeota archaeon]|nr:TIM barrel protein [Candidatus Woesearchaeota archaeon]